MLRTSFFLTSFFQKQRLYAARLLLIGVLLGTFPQGVEAQIVVNDVIRNLKFGDRPIVNIDVLNTADFPLRVESSSSLIINPGLESEERQENDDIILSPRNFSVNGEGRRTVRAIFRRPAGDVERVYSITFAPSARGGDTDESGGAQKKAAIRLLTGMGILYFVEPKVPQAKLAWQRSGDTLTLSNEGNIHIKISNMEHCADETDTDCEKLPGRRIHPGQSRDWRVPAERTVKLMRAIGDGRQAVSKTIPPKS